MKLKWIILKKNKQKKNMTYNPVVNNLISNLLSSINE